MSIGITSDIHPVVYATIEYSLVRPEHKVKVFYADHLSAYFIFRPQYDKYLPTRQDLQDFQDFFAFPEERQKSISLFEGFIWL